MVERSRLYPMSVPALRIGNVKIGFPVVLAPMAGYTDAAFRSICKDFGASLTFTEVANAAGLVYGSKPTFHLLRTAKNESPVTAHIYGCDPEVMARSARIIEDLGRFDIIDINCGCPVRKIVAKGCGAALMKDPDLIREIVAAVVSEVSMPVTIKTRLGLDDKSVNIFQTATAAEQGGASAVSVHARTANKKHNGPADWVTLASVKKEISIPLIGNGGVNEPVDALRMLEETGVDGVMIGRAAVGDPWIFRDIKDIFAGKKIRKHSLASHRKIIFEHLDRCVELAEREQRNRRKKTVASERAALHFRAHLFKYTTGFKGSKGFARALQTMNTPEAVQEAVTDLLNQGR